ncbi:MAG: hypothetical protein PUJ39_01670, partial [Eubacteriales bacterium]|nr:hypothetical protein [Eubacteriales bacterium]
NALKEGVLLSFLQLFKEKRTQIPALIIGRIEAHGFSAQGKQRGHAQYDQDETNKKNRQRFHTLAMQLRLILRISGLSLHSSALLSRTAASAARATVFKGEGRMRGKPSCAQPAIVRQQ